MIFCDVFKHWHSTGQAFLFKYKIKYNEQFSLMFYLCFEMLHSVNCFEILYGNFDDKFVALWPLKWRVILSKSIWFYPAAPLVTWICTYPLPFSFSIYKAVSLSFSQLQADFLYVFEKLFCWHVVCINLKMLVEIFFLFFYDNFYKLRARRCTMPAIHYLTL